jgi:hypothetical protein
MKIGAIDGVRAWGVVPKRYNERPFWGLLLIFAVFSSSTFVSNTKNGRGKKATEMCKILIAVAIRRAFGRVANRPVTVANPIRERYMRAADQARLARNAMVRTMAAR